MAVKLGPTVKDDCQQDLIERKPRALVKA